MAAVHIERKLQGPPEQVWAELTAPARWLPFGVAAWESRPGGRIAVRLPGGAEVSGEVTEAEPARRLVFSWTRPNWPAPTRVEIRLEPAGAATRLTLTHHHLRPDLRELYQRTWAVALDRLEERLAERPAAGRPAPAG